MKNKLNAQELRNILFAGPWIEDAKAYFSTKDCFASVIGNIYMEGSVEEQDYLDTVLTWIADAEGVTVEEYMAEHQYDADATQLKRYFERVIVWTDRTFRVYRWQLMRGQPWGLYYNAHKGNHYDPDELEYEIRRFLANPRVTNPRSIYEYLLIKYGKNEA